ncbi:MAG TPA: DUF1501 domain-containing protein [Planctomycetaceae bacterium]|nr:DUF1501 domain-containing protein [Planctomycetaceae bacterium]
MIRKWFEHSPTDVALMRRRELLQVGFSTAMGLGLSGVLSSKGAAGEQRSERRSGRAKSVIIIYQTGGASQIDTLDPKPDAPDDVRGEFRSIASRVPGIRVAEHLPRFASQSERWAIIRSMSHKNAGHLTATHQVLTGRPIPGLAEDVPADKVASRQDWPCYASALNSLRPRQDGVPSGVNLPTFLVEGPLTWPGQHAGLLGAQHDPWQIRSDPSAANFREETLHLLDGLSLNRLQDRKSLLAEMDRQRRTLAIDGEQQLSGQYQAAFNLLTSGRLTQAFDLNREPAAVRDRYGRHMFGQSLLLVRRLVEAGVPIVQCNMGIVQTWDNHADIFNVLKNRLLPPFDQGVAALMDDLHARGLLDHTLVALFGEFGRTPKLSILPGQTQTGRDHWPHVFSAAFAGAGVCGGQVIGSSDAIGGYPASMQFGPSELAATIYDALGIRPDALLQDRLGRPFTLCAGEPISQLYTGNGV